MIEPEIDVGEEQEVKKEESKETSKNESKEESEEESSSKQWPDGRKVRESGGRRHCDFGKPGNTVLCQ